MASAVESEHEARELQGGLTVLLLSPTPSCGRVSSMPSDDRVECAHCGRRMVPRLITAYGELKESVCPFCGGTFRDFRRPVQ